MAVSSQRRKLLLTVSTGVLAGKALPEKWVSPIISQVMLPAHAQTSVLTCTLPGSWTLRDTSPSSTDAGTSLLLHDDMTGLYDGTETVTWSEGSNSVTLITIAFGTSTATLNGTFNADCSTLNGTWTNTATGSSGSWEASLLAGTTSLSTVASNGSNTAFR